MTVDRYGTCSYRWPLRLKRYSIVCISMPRFAARREEAQISISSRYQISHILARICLCVINMPMPSVVLRSIPRIDPCDQTIDPSSRCFFCNLLRLAVGDDDTELRSLEARVAPSSVVGSPRIGLCLPKGLLSLRTETLRC